MRLSATFIGALLGIVPATATASDAPLRAELTCRTELKSGRVLCDATLNLTRGRLVWADVLIVRAPEFAQPLKNRLGFTKNASFDESNARFALALVAKSAGRGKLDALIRAVVCEGTNAQERTLCRPRSVAVSADVSVAEAAKPR